MAMRVLCLQCQTVLVSQSKYDTQTCGCPNATFVEGDGEFYTRYGGNDVTHTATEKDGKWVPTQLLDETVDGTPPAG